MQIPPGVRYKVFKTKKLAIYYLFDDTEIGQIPEKKVVCGGHEFYFFKEAVVIKPIKETSQAQEAPST